MSGVEKDKVAASFPSREPSQEGPGRQRDPDLCW